ncbi:hypothetical protein C479_04037 [Halovivax asiaticus JCM 14624]|uniref:Uncharacterized protein n=1 Tax=Halovivax asiaticus JCM 14624 TaxID=1227490 RepID=M0BS91_9EURY|nr:hypothetical protein [Halovivax asiaticus]ELZ12534.1 hypothetical protein C479_04037 [Halovivax asiaticus JCM 14624]
MHPDEGTGAIYRKILEELSPPDGHAVSSARILENVDADTDDISDAIGDLLRFGELEYINTSGSNMHVRVRLHRPTENPHEQATLTDARPQQQWLAYIADDHNPRTTRSRRLFTTRAAAERHLEAVGGCDELTPVPGLESVWYDYLGECNSEYAVLRTEPIFTQFDDPWP